jgi:peptidyl-prolyl cis-trans isomerase C
VDVSDLVVAVSHWVGLVARSRLLHFAAIGALIFAVAPASRQGRHVSVSREYLESLYAAQAQKLGVAALSAAAREEVDRRAVEDEVLYREALRMGLDRDDAVVRQHLIQKSLVLAEDLAGASRDPSRADVEAYFEAHPDRFRRGQEVRLIHVFAARRETLSALADVVRAAEAERPGIAPALGDAFPLSRDVRATGQDLATTYGEPFAEAVLRQPMGVWSEPVVSRFGFHLVKIVDKSPGRLETFAEAEGRARLELADERRRDANARFIRRAMERYEVDIDGERVPPGPSTDRLAMRASLSGED